MPSCRLGFCFRLFWLPTGNPFFPFKLLYRYNKDKSSPWKDLFFCVISLTCLFFPLTILVVLSIIQSRKKKRKIFSVFFFLLLILASLSTCTGVHNYYVFFSVVRVRERKRSTTHSVVFQVNPKELTHTHRESFVRSFSLSLFLTYFEWRRPCPLLRVLVFSFSFSPSCWTVQCSAEREREKEWQILVHQTSSW